MKHQRPPVFLCRKCGVFSRWGRKWLDLHDRAMHQGWEERRRVLGYH